MLPKLSIAGGNFSSLFPDSGFLSRNLVYCILLVSILLFLGLERASEHYQHGIAAARWLQTGSHGLYCFVIGYVSVELPLPKISMHVLANVIMATHLLGMIIHLREHFPGIHISRSRWWFSGLVIADELPRRGNGEPRWFLLGTGLFVASFVFLQPI